MDEIFDKPKPHKTKEAFFNRVPYWRLAKVLGTSEAQVSRWLNGIVQPTPEIDEKLNELAQAVTAKRFERGTNA